MVAIGKDLLTVSSIQSEVHDLIRVTHSVLSLVRSRLELKCQPEIGYGLLYGWCHEILSMVDGLHRVKSIYWSKDPIVSCMTEMLMWVQIKLAAQCISVHGEILNSFFLSKAIHNKISTDGISTVGNTLTTLGTKYLASMRISMFTDWNGPPLE